MANYRVTVKVTLRKSILDPQGNATQHALHSLGFERIRSVRIGKHVEMVVEASDEEAARATADSAAAKLLANPVMDDFEITDIREEEAAAASA